MWYFQILFQGMLFLSIPHGGLEMQNGISVIIKNSEVGCNQIVSAATFDMNRVFDINVYGTAMNNGAITRRTDWVFQCVKLK